MHSTLDNGHFRTLAITTKIVMDCAEFILSMPNRRVSSVLKPMMDWLYGILDCWIENMMVGMDLYLVKKTQYLTATTRTRYHMRFDGEGRLSMTEARPYYAIVSRSGDIGGLVWISTD